MKKLLLFSMVLLSGCSYNTFSALPNPFHMMPTNNRHPYEGCQYADCHSDFNHTSNSLCYYMIENGVFVEYCD